MSTQKNVRAVEHKTPKMITREKIFFGLYVLCLFIGALKFSGGSPEGVVPVEEQINPNYYASACYLLVGTIFYWLGRASQMMRAIGRG